MDNIAIELRNVSKSFKQGILFDNVNISVKQGDIIGIVGENGSGKSVLFKIMTGLAIPDNGEVYIRGEKLGEKRDFPENVGVFINSPGYIEIYSGLKNLMFLANISGKADKNKIIETMKMVGLDPNNSIRVKNYSLGMKQKLGIAQAIMEDQDIIILDEPFNALDFKTKKDIYDIIVKLHNQGKTLLITSHNFRDIQNLCSMIYIINGEKVEVLTEEMKQMYTENIM